MIHEKPPYLDPEWHNALAEQRDIYTTPTTRLYIIGEALGICLNGLCIVKPIKDWHTIGKGHGLVK